MLYKINNNHCVTIFYLLYINLLLGTGPKISKIMKEKRILLTKYPLLLRKIDYGITVAN